MSAKDRLSNVMHRSPLGVLVINYRRIINQKRSLRKYDDKTALQIIYKRKLGRDLNLENPQRFTEKLQWLKLYYRNPVMTTCADKIAVREYLAQRGYGEYLMPLVGVYRDVSDISVSELPEKCIFKASRGSSMHIVMKKHMSKLPLSWKLIMNSWLKMNIYAEGREWPYKDIEPGIICEKFIEASSDEKMRDYKFFCFNGEPSMIQVDIDLLDKHRINFYDMQWNLLELKGQYQNSEQIINRPANFDKMIEIARDLSRPFPHVRVDFYEYDRILKIGELTFFDGSGFYSFTPDDFDFILGERLSIYPYVEQSTSN